MKILGWFSSHESPPQNCWIPNGTTDRCGSAGAVRASVDGGASNDRAAARVDKERYPHPTEGLDLFRLNLPSS